MRIFQDLKEAINESRRILAEMGLKRQRYYQSIGQKTETRELIGYGFHIIPKDSNWLQNPYADQEYCTYEFRRRIEDHSLPPNIMEFTTVTKELRKNETLQIFDKLAMDYRGKRVFSYDYAERLYGKIRIIIGNLLSSPNSRQQIAMIYRSEDLLKSEKVRVPCSMYYHFMIAEGKLHMVYTMRSSDVMTHFPNDLTLAGMIANYVGRCLDIPVGSFVFFSDNLHEYVSNLEGIF